MPVTITTEIKPRFQALVDTKTLEKGLHGMTQNCNEPFNQFIWKRCPEYLHLKNVLKLQF